MTLQLQGWDSDFSLIALGWLAPATSQWYVFIFF